MLAAITTVLDTDLVEWEAWLVITEWVVLLAPPSIAPIFQRETKKALKDGDGVMADTMDMVTDTVGGDTQLLTATPSRILGSPALASLATP